MESAFTQQTVNASTDLYGSESVSKCEVSVFLQLIGSVCLSASYQLQPINKIHWRFFWFFLFFQNINHSCHSRHFSCQTLSPQQSQQARHHRTLQHSLQLGYVMQAWERLVFSFILFAGFTSKRKEMISLLTVAVITSESREWPVFFCLKCKSTKENRR